MPALDRASGGLVAVVALLGTCGWLAACGSSSDRSPASAGRSQHAQFAGATNQDPGPAAPLRLRDSLGRTVDLRDYRGKAVLVTFIYTHCPDVCPLIVGNLHTALARLGAQARRLQIVAVSTDPRGDTPATVKTFLRQHEMTGRMEYLLGNRRRLAGVWRAWGVLAKRDRQSPEFVEHSALIYGIGASGRLLTVYPSNFKPAWVVHDAPLLAAR